MGLNLGLDLDELDGRGRLIIGLHAAFGLAWIGIAALGLYAGNLGQAVVGIGVAIGISALGVAMARIQSRK